MKKLLATVDINYNKDITNITVPYMEQHAKKIGADFLVINKRKFINDPINCEKFQIYDISKDYDWTILIDCDALIHPNCPDITDCANKDTLILHAYDLYPIRFKQNIYTKRDGRNIGACTWLTIFSNWTRDLWKPHEDPLQYVNQISLANKEKNFGYKEEHIIDDYLVSLNIAKYGLNVKTILFDLFDSYPKDGYPLFFIHQYCISQEDKIRYLKNWDEIIKFEQMDINLNRPSFLRY